MAAGFPGGADDAIRPVLRFWRGGVRTDHSGAVFWGTVAAWMARFEAEAPDRRISIVLGHTSPSQITLFLALIASGRLAALFPPSNRKQDEAAYLAQQRGALGRIDPAAIYVFDTDTVETLRRVDAGLAARCVVLPETVAPRPEAAVAARARFLARLDDTAPIFVQHSSGTTGVKKAVAITGVALAAQYRAYWPLLRRYVHGAEDRPLTIASWLPLYHDMGLLTSLLLPAIGGDCVSIVDPFEWIGNPGLLPDMIAADRAEIAWMPNFAFRHLVRLAGNMTQRDLSSMRMWVDCSEPCRFADARAFEAAFAGWGVAPGSVLGCYAMAETVFAATQAAPGAQRALAVPGELAPGSVLHEAGCRVVTGPEEAQGRLVLSSGAAVGCVEVAVLVQGALAREGVYGELAVRGPAVFEGYRGMSPAESGFTAEGWYRTGDLGAVVDGQVYVFGRIKEMIIVNGKNLFAGDLEAAINLVPGVKPGRVAAFGLDSAQTGSEELVVVAEHDPGSGTEPAAVRQAISRGIADQFLVTPRDVRVVDERWLVKSSSGKIGRGENAAKYLATFRAGRKPG